MNLKKNLGNFKEKISNVEHKKAIALVIAIGLVGTLFIGWTLVGVFYGEEILEEQEDLSFTVGGSTTCFPMILECAREFMKDHPDYDISVAGTGSRVGVEGVINNIYEVGMASSDPDSYDPDGITSETSFAHDAVILAMSAGNSHFSGGFIPSLTMEQIRSIFNETYATWDDLHAVNSEFTGGSEEIITIGRDANSGTRKSFEELTHVQNVVYDQELNSNGAVQAAIKSDDDYIGYVGVAFLSGLDALEIETIAPSLSNIKSHTYPLSRYLYLVWKGEPERKVQRFLDFVFGSEGQAAVEKAGGVALF